MFILYVFQDEDKDDKKTDKKSEDKKDDKKTDDKKADDKKADEKKAGTSTTADEKKKDEKEEKKKEPEPSNETLQNPARVLRQQLKVVSLNENSQYVPMKDASIGGIVMVRNLKPGEEELVEPVAGKFVFCFINFSYQYVFSFWSKGRGRKGTRTTRTF